MGFADIHSPSAGRKAPGFQKPAAMATLLLRCALLLFPGTAPLAQETLSEFDQPQGFSKPEVHSLAGFSVSFSHQSMLEVSDNINLFPDAVAESGWAYTGNLKASLRGELLGSQLMGSIGGQYLTQTAFKENDDNASTELLADLKLRTQLGDKLVNLFNVSRNEEFVNTSETIYLTRSSGTVTQQAVQDSLQLALTKTWHAELTAYANFAEYEQTEIVDAGSDDASTMTGEFDREDYSLRGELAWSAPAVGTLYVLAQATDSGGGSAAFEALDQRSYSAGIGLRQLTGSTQYQVELAYGEAETKQVGSVSPVNTRQSALLGQATVMHQYTPDLRLFATIRREVSVDPVSSVTGQLITDIVGHLQYSITADSYLALRLEYPHIKVFNTNYSFEVPSAGVRFGHRFSERINVEMRLQYEEQVANAAAEQAGFTEYREAEAKLLVNILF